MKNSSYLAKTSSIRFIVLILVLIALLGCPNPTNDDSGDTTDPYSDVQNLVGTFSFGDSAAAIELDIDQTGGSSVSSSGRVTAAAAVGVSGTVVYEGETFSVSGTFDTVSGAVNASATGNVGGDTVAFTVEGTYSSSDGFEGTVKRRINGGSEETGSIDLKAVSDQVKANGVQHYLGGYGGTASGRWNMTVIDGDITGSWYESNDNYGYVRGSQNGTIVTGEAFGAGDNYKIAGFTGTVDGNAIGGTWAGGPSNTYDSGYWSGQRSGTSVGTADTIPGRLARIFVALETGADLAHDVNNDTYDGTVDGTYNDNDGGGSVAVDFSDTDDSAIYTYTNYDDDATGVSVTSGKVYIADVTASVYVISADGTNGAVLEITGDPEIDRIRLSSFAPDQSGGTVSGTLEYSTDGGSTWVDAMSVFESLF